MAEEKYLTCIPKPMYEYSQELWTPLICASKAGHLDVVKLLVESGASPLAKTSKGHSPIWFAAAEIHIPVLSYLMKKEHDTYGLMDDKEVVNTAKFRL
jgi:ankyrin repeat protein